MKKIVLTIGSLLSLMLLFLTLNGSLLFAQSEKQAMTKGFAIVELFTSQGCSSCPPADRLLTDLVEKAEKEGINIIPLSFHVDYWNYLGWKDPFSKKEFSLRQRRYASVLSSGVYTPQMVFNGKEECVGSNRYKVNNLIEKVITAQSQDKIAFEVNKMEDGTAFRVDYEVEGKLLDKLIHFALIEKNISTQVGRGENHGRLLRHDNVVREFKSFELLKKGSVLLNIPTDLDLKNSQVVAYTQDAKTLEIFGVNLSDL